MLDYNMTKGLIIKALVICSLLLLIVAGRVFYLQRSHFTQAEKYYSESNYKLALREYDTAMHFYTPFSPYINRSAERLWGMGGMFEADDKLQWANAAYAAIRSSFYASRSLYTPGRDWIRRCDEKIADINVRILLKEGSIKPEDAEAEKMKHLRVMTVDRAPAPLWAAIAGIGFLGWIGSIIFVIFRGFDKAGKVSRKPALIGVGSFAVFFALWVLALLKA